MFGVDMFNGSITQVNAMVVQEGLSYPIFLNGSGLIKGTENPKSRDELFIVDKKGIIVFYKYYGIYDSYSIPSGPVETAIQTALDKSTTSLTKINKPLQRSQEFNYRQVAQNKIDIQFFSNLSTELFLDIFTHQGLKIETLSSVKTNSLYNYKVNLLSVSSGIYIVSIRNKNKIISSHKILIRK